MIDFVVVGGGLIGGLTALELRRAGARVLLLERGRIGRESSWAGGGILSPLHPWRSPDALTPLVEWSQVAWPELASSLARTGIDPQWTRSGMLVVESDETEQARRWAAARNVPFEVVDGCRAPGLEPALGKGEGAALWFPQVAQIRNPRLVAALGVELLVAGVKVRSSTAVTAVRAAAGRTVGVETEAGFLAAARVVVAAGAWSEPLLRPLGLHVDITPVRGQMILFQAPPGAVKRIVLRGDRYLVPRRDGRVLAGSTMEQAGYDKSTTHEALTTLRAAAVDLVPMLAECPIEHHWAGLRPGSPRGIPFIGEHPRCTGLYVNSGHFRNGVVTAPASARLLADIALDRAPILDPSPYALTAER